MIKATVALTRFVELTCDETVLDELITPNSHIQAFDSRYDALAHLAGVNEGFFSPTKRDDSAFILGNVSTRLLRRTAVIESVSTGE